MTLPDPSYITADEVKAQSRITGLKEGSTGALSPEDIKFLIQEAEGQIDDYCGRQPHHPYDSNLDRVFPREQDFSVSVVSGERYEYPDTPVIPLDISRACLKQVEWLYTQWWPSSTSAQTPVRHEVSQRAIGADGSYSETRAGSGIDFTSASLSPQAKAILDNGYRSRWAPIGTSRVC